MDSTGDRINPYGVWSYGPGDDDYYLFLVVDISRPSNEASFIYIDVLTINDAS
jgi:hypothetical protein